MFRLPSPPRFTLPPPPMPSSDIFDKKLLAHLTCSSIRQQAQYSHRQIISSRLMIISCIGFLTIIFIFTLLLMIISIYRRRKSSSYNESQLSPPVPSIKPNNVSMITSRSYETISSEHTGIYMHSINTSATTCSTDPSNIHCIYYYHHEEYDYSDLSPPPYYHTLESLPS